MFRRSIQNTVFHLQPPDHCEQRDDKFLFIWKDIPHWMVVDEEVRTLLYLFEEGACLRDLFKSHPDFGLHQRQLSSLIRDLSEKKVLVSGRMDEKTKKPVQESSPIENISWNLTHRCNLRCCYCYYHDGLHVADGNELSAQDVIGFLNAVKPFLPKRVTMTVLGGEPLLYPTKLIDVCRAAVRLGMTPLVSTNGTLIDAAFAKEARRIGLEVQVSLDGPTPEINDPLRGNGTFDKIRQGVSVLRSHGVKTILSMVCCRQNFESLEAFLDLAIQWKVPEARFIPLKHMGAATAHHLEMVPHYEIVTTAWQLLKKHPEYRHLFGRDCLTILANTCRYSDQKLSCGTGSQTFLLDVDGRLYPCLNLNRPEFAFGHIFDKNFDFKEIWKNSKALKHVRAAVNIGNADGPCATCPVRFWCLGGCRGETYANTGQLSARSIHCGDLRRTIIEIFWILSESPGIIKLY